MLRAYEARNRPLSPEEREYLGIRHAVSGKILEAGQLLLQHQQSMDPRKAYGETGEIPRAAGKKEFPFPWELLYNNSRSTQENQGGNCAKWTTKQSMRSGCPTRILMKLQKKNCVRSQDDDKEIKERFYKDLEFGTAGLRGVIGAGINRMNIYVVRRATQGLANYIIKQGGQG